MQVNKETHMYKELTEEGRETVRYLRHLDEWQHLMSGLRARQTRLFSDIAWGNSNKSTWGRYERINRIVELQDMKEWNPQRYAYIRHSFLGEEL